jgi:hypothetical protein
MTTRTARAFRLGAGAIVGLMAIDAQLAPASEPITPELKDKLAEATAKQQPDLVRGVLFVFDPTKKPTRYRTLAECQAAQAAKGAGVCVNERERR